VCVLYTTQQQHLIDMRETFQTMLLIVYNLFMKNIDFIAKYCQLEWQLLMLVMMMMKWYEEWENEKWISEVGRKI
jgi:hypothetical protein